MSSCCDTSDDKKKAKFDYLLWGSLSVITIAYFVSMLFAQGVISEVKYIGTFSHATFDLLNKMWWGVLLGILFVGLLDKIPREFVVSALGRKKGIVGILRATLAGVALDLCSHGILLVGMKLYERGVRLSQVMAFLIASPWNSLSLTLILWALIGFKWMMAFLLLSVVIAIISGLIFEKLVDSGKLPSNPNDVDIPDDFMFLDQIKKQYKKIKIDSSFCADVMKNGLKSSKMILRWIFFGIVLASLIRTFLSAEDFQTLFGPTLLGLAFTLFAATVIEVCSEGSTPIAADIMNRANAPGNSFAFLMTGVATDYTEIISLKETTKSWKISLFLPLVTLPQVIIIGILLNFMSF